MKKLFISIIFIFLLFSCKKDKFDYEVAKIHSNLNITKIWWDNFKDIRWLENIEEYSDLKTEKFLEYLEKTKKLPENISIWWKISEKDFQKILEKLINISQKNSFEDLNIIFSKKYFTDENLEKISKIKVKNFFEITTFPENEKYFKNDIIVSEKILKLFIENWNNEKNISFDSLDLNSSSENRCKLENLEKIKWNFDIWCWWGYYK